VMHKLGARTAAEAVRIGVWAALAMYTIACDFNVGAPIVAGLCAIAAYMVGSDAVIRRIRSFRA